MDLKRARMLRRQGASFREIAATMGVSPADGSESSGRIAEVRDAILERSYDNR
jgi:hypothetical protein